VKKINENMLKILKKIIIKIRKEIRESMKAVEWAAELWWEAFCCTGRKLNSEVKVIVKVVK